MYDVRLAATSDSALTGGNFSFNLELDNDTANTSNVQVTAIGVSGGGAVVGALNQNVLGGDRGRYGAFTAGLVGAGPWTITATVQVTDNVTGQISTDTITWDIASAAAGLRNDRYLYTNAAFGGAAQIVLPTSNKRFATAKLVDAEGKDIVAGQPGFLKIYAEDSANGIGIDELNSQELGIVGQESTTQTKRGFSHFFELNNFFVRNATLKNSAINFKVRQDIKDNPSKIAAGELALSKQPTIPNAKPLYTYDVGAGSQQAAKRLGELQAKRIAFSATTAIPAIGVSFSGYIAEIIGQSSSKANLASSNAEREKLLSDGLEKRSKSLSGVNIDEEIANTVLYQNAYKANAEVINVVKDLFESLLQAV